MKITLINAEWLPVPPVRGGAVEHTVYDTAISTVNHNMSVISPWDERLERCSDSEGIFHHVNLADETRRICDTLAGHVPLGPRALNYFSYLNGMADHLLKIDPDLIQVHNRSDFLPYLQKQFPTKSLIAYMHNEPRHTGRGLSEAIEGLAHMVFVSRNLATKYHEAHPICEGKSTVIYNGVDTQRFRPELKNARATDRIRARYGLAEGRTALFVGRTVSQKGVTFLLEAMETLRLRFPKMKLLIAGSPLYDKKLASPFLDHLKCQARALGDSVAFAGYVPHDTIPYFYVAADVTVVPSLWDEPFGKVVIESMACGVPVVGSRKGAIPEIIDDGVDGMCVDRPRRPGELADVIGGLLTDRELRLRLGNSARTKVLTKFSKLIRRRNVARFYDVLRENLVPHEGDVR